MGVIITLMSGCFSVAFSQILQNYGTVISAKSGSVITVNGSVLNQTGIIDVNENAGTPAVMYVSQDVTNNATISADGHIHLSGNWFDNGAFTSTLGTVFMDGATQFLGGTSATVFHHLTLNGSGFKIQQVDKYATGTLSLNHLELKTETFAFYMENTALVAITRTSGFVSSLNGGFLARKTNATGMYLYPVGSSVGVTRYRPVEITPVNTTANQYTVRLANLDATLEGYDRTLHNDSICDANPQFYHQINRPSGNASADIVVNFDPAVDGSWNALSRWNLTSPMWENITGSFITSGSPFARAQRLNWGTFSDIPYILTTPVTQPMFDPVGPFCQGASLPALPTVSINGINGTWSPALNNQQTTTYTFTPDAGACGLTATMTVQINPAANAPNAMVTDPTCSTITGTIETTFPISLSGNAITYTLIGINPPVAAQSNFTGMFNNLGSGTYELTATEDGCTSSPAPLTISVVPSGPAAPQIQVIQPSCNSSTGTINVQNPSPAAGITYYVTPINPAGSVLNNSTGLFSGLLSGDYSITVTVNGCTSAVTNATLNNVSIPPAPIVSITQPTCNSSTGGIQVTNIPPSTTTLYNVLPVAPSGPLQSNTSGSFSNLTSGSYNVTVTVFGCNSPITSVVIIPQPVTPTLTVNSPSMCAGQPTNLVAVGSPAGGSYQWAGSTVTTGILQVSPTATQSYNVTYTLGVCSAQAQALVTVVNTPTVQLLNADVCSGDSVTLVAMPSAPGGSFTWFPTGDTTVSITVSPSSSSHYTVTYMIGQCSSQPVTATVNVHDYPTAEFLSNPAVFSSYSETVQFENTSTGAVSYQWDFGDGYTSGLFNPSHLFQSIEEDGYVITLTAISAGGCTDTFAVWIDQKDLLVYYVPNTFTPDGNSANETFKPVFTSGFDPYNFRLLVYNRWGEMIFESHDSEVGWDGNYGTGGNVKKCQDGTYVWKIDFKRSDNDEYISLTGHVNLVR